MLSTVSTAMPLRMRTSAKAGSNSAFSASPAPVRGRCRGMRQVLGGMNQEGSTSLFGQFASIPASRCR